MTTHMPEIDLPTREYLVPERELHWRVGRLQRHMVAAGIDAMALAQNADLLYFSGSVVNGWMLIPAQGEPELHLRRGASRAAAETCWQEIHTTHSTRQLAAAPVLRESTTIAVELDVLPAADYLKLAELLPAARFVDATHHVRCVRAVKSEWELGWMRAAARQVTAAMDAVREQVRAGANEMEVALLTERVMREAGHQGIMRMRRFNGEMFFGQVCAGPNAALQASLDAPLGGAGRYPSVGKGPTSRRIAAGEPLVIDLMGAANGYLSDCTRVFAVGELSDDLVAAHEWCIDVLDEIRAAMRPGARPSQLYELALEMAREAGYDDRFMGIAPDQARFVGHGVGMEVDEYPFLAKGFDDPLEPGMTCAVEPKLVFPGRAAVGVEDTLVVTGAGAEALPAPPHGLIPLPA